MPKTSIKDYFEEDHKRLDKLLETYRELKREDFKKAKEAFKEFISGLKRHIAWEESILFPLFESRASFAHNGPTEIMRMEHRQIRESLDRIHEKVARRETDGDEEERNLYSLLVHHNVKEENVLYPMIDRSLGEGDLEKVFQAMNEIKPSKRSCC